MKKMYVAFIATHRLPPLVSEVLFSVTKIG